MNCGLVLGEVRGSGQVGRYDREDRIIDRLQRENKELKKENRSLQQRLKRVSRGYKAYLDKDPLEEPSRHQENAKLEGRDADKVCWECNGSLKVIIVGNRRFRKCDQCDKRTKVRIING
jgi:hypothetical protein